MAASKGPKYERAPLTKREERANTMGCEHNPGGTHLFLGRLIADGVEVSFTDRCVHCDLTAARLVR